MRGGGGGGGGELTAFMGGSDTFHGRVSDSFQGRGEDSDGFHREGGGGGRLAVECTVKESGKEWEVILHNP